MVQRPAEGEVPDAQDGAPDALDQKGNRYYRRKLLHREFLAKDLMRLTFELPPGVSLKSLGFDIGLGDFVRMRPHAEEHKKLIENPAGGRAYSPVLPPATQGRFGFIVKAYGPEDAVVGVSSLLRRAPIGTELLVTNHVEHVFWKERNRGYYCNERNVDPEGGGPHHVGLIAFGIGITEIAPVAASELLDPRVARVTVLWANRRWSDAEWAWPGAEDVDGGARDSCDLVRRFFAEQGRHGERLRVMHILSQDRRPEAAFHGRITADVLRQAFLRENSGEAPQREQLRFLAVGTTAMTNFAYETLAGLGLDVVHAAAQGHWGGGNLLYRKRAAAAAPADRRASPLLASEHVAGGRRTAHAAEEEPPSKRSKI